MSSSQKSETPRLNLIGREEMLERVPVSYPVIWRLMLAGQFPLAKKIGGKSFWLADEIDQFLANLPSVKLGTRLGPRKATTETKPGPKRVTKRKPPTVARSATR